LRKTTTTKLKIRITPFKQRRQLTTTNSASEQ